MKKHRWAQSGHYSGGVWRFGPSPNRLCKDCGRAYWRVRKYSIPCDEPLADIIGADGTLMDYKTASDGPLPTSTPNSADVTDDV